MATMTVYSEVKRLYSSLQEMVGLRRRKRQLQISEPFNFKKETTILPGLTEDEITVLREKAAASRLGLAPTDTYPLLHSHPLSPRMHIPQPPFIITTNHNGGGSDGSGPLSLSSPPPPPPPPSLPRLSIPTPVSIPIPIPNAGAGVGGVRHGSSGSSSLRSSSTSVSAFAAAAAAPGTGTGTGPLDSHAVRVGMGSTATERTSASVNDLDLLLFGNPSGVGNAVDLGLVGPGAPGVGGMGKGVAVTEVSPLELDFFETTRGLGRKGSGGGGGVVDWDLEFEFQLGSPVSPLTPRVGEEGRREFVF